MKTWIAHGLVCLLVLAFIVLGFAPLAAQASTQITAGFQHTCALNPAGNAICWGLNASGDAPLVRIGPFTQITAGTYHTCALTPAGNATCWGTNGDGQAPPTRIGPFTQIAAGRNHTCALTPAGNATCWGWNLSGQAPPSLIGPFTQITAGGDHTCALTSAGDLTCWGDNSFGSAPSSKIGPFTQITAGAYHGCALTPAGNAICWGSNDIGEAPPVRIGPFTRITAGGNYTCALTPAGDAVCWGGNSNGEAPPSRIGPFTQITAGSIHTCALTPAGDATCWGDNYLRQSIPQVAMIYSTGFEPSTFSPAAINGQGGWNGSGVIQGAVVYREFQALHIDATSGGSPAADVPLSYTIGSSRVSFRVKFQATGSGTAFTGIALFGDTGFLAQLGSSGGNYLLGNSNTATASLPFAAGAWYDLMIDLDFPSRTMTGYVDGQLLGSLAINPPSPATRLTALRLFSSGSGTTPQDAYLDNAALSRPVPLPEPSSAWAFGTIALAALAIVRRSRL